MSNISETTVRDFFYDAATSYGFINVNKELSIEGLRIDIFAIDSNHNPYIIEFKKKKDRHIVGQSAQYLAIAPTYKDEISKKINFYTINWENLNIILVAPSYYDRDLTAANYAPLKDKVHFYTYKVIETSRKKVFGLQLKYIGPSESGPINLIENNLNTSDLIDVYKHFEKLDTRESRREYYTNKILPLLTIVKNKIESFFNNKDLYPHISYFGNKTPYYMIRVGTDKKQTHKASIIISFYNDVVDYGFDLTHSLEEGKLLSKLLKDENINVQIVKEILQKKDYYLYIPSTGFRFGIPINGLMPEALKCVLNMYSPEKHKDCYFRINKYYENESLSVDDATEILMKEYEEFKFIFDLLKN